MADIDFEEVQLGTAPTGVGGDVPRTAFGKITRNFNKVNDFLADGSNAASRKVGTSTGDVMEVGAFKKTFMSDTRSYLNYTEKVVVLGGMNWGQSSNGTLRATRVTGIANAVELSVRMAVGDPSYGVRGSISIYRSSLSSVEPITFMYKGSPMFGVRVYFGSSQLEGFNWDGFGTQPPFVVPLYNRNTDTVLNQEIYDSMETVSAVAVAQLLDTDNTTTDSNGFIKAASPIIKLFDDSIEKTDHLEIQSAALEKLGTGKYKLTGVPELSRDGWYIETPKDRNNNIYFTLDYEELDGELIIKTYEPDYSSGRAENGAPVDILEGRFVSLRFAENPELYPEPEDEQE